MVAVVPRAWSPEASVPAARALGLMEAQVLGEEQVIGDHVVSARCASIVE